MLTLLSTSMKSAFSTLLKPMNTEKNKLIYVGESNKIPQCKDIQVMLFQPQTYSKSVEVLFMQICWQIN